jgi:choline dehydrogenase-like flavoprotein
MNGLRLARELMRQTALERFVRKEVLPGEGIDNDHALFDYACTHAKTDHHPVGTCRMGREGDAESVVTPDLRVIGMEGLRIVDASVMPFIPSCNTNAPTIMIAEKAADHILDRVPTRSPARAEPAAAARQYIE